jgi:hypothetical protein
VLERRRHRNANWQRATRSAAMAVIDDTFNRIPRLAALPPPPADPGARRAGRPSNRAASHASAGLPPREASPPYLNCEWLARLRSVSTTRSSWCGSQLGCGPLPDVRRVRPAEHIQVPGRLASPRWNVTHIAAFALVSRSSADASRAGTARIRPRTKGTQTNRTTADFADEPSQPPTESLSPLYREQCPAAGYNEMQRDRAQP